MNISNRVDSGVYLNADTASTMLTVYASEDVLLSRGNLEVLDISPLKMLSVACTAGT